MAECGLRLGNKKEETEFFRKNSVSLQYKQEIIQRVLETTHFKKGIKAYASGGVSISAMSFGIFRPCFRSKSGTLS